MTRRKELLAVHFLFFHELIPLLVSGVPGRLCDKSEGFEMQSHGLLARAMSEELASPSLSFSHF